MVYKLSTSFTNTNRSSVNDKIYNDYFVSTHDINEFKHNRSEIADELLKIIDCLNRTEINELKNAESWQ